MSEPVDAPPEAPQAAPLLNGVVKRQLRAAEYRDREAEAARLAQASGLANVREKHERAAARWAELAELDEGKPA